MNGIDFDAPAKLMKWPSLRGERISPEDGAAPYTIVQASLADCVRRLLSKPEPTRHLYEIHTSDGTVLPAANTNQRPKKTSAEATSCHRDKSRRRTALSS